MSKTSWVLVAGYLKKGDTAEATVVREIKEETGLDAEKMIYISSYYHEKKGLLMLGFLAFVKKQEFKRSIEVDDIEWFNCEEAKRLLRAGSIGETHFRNACERINLG